MKISTTRTLFVTLDVALSLAIGAVVYGEFRAKSVRGEVRGVWEREWVERLNVEAKTVDAGIKKSEWEYLNVPIVPAPPKAAATETPVAPEVVNFVPLETMIQVKGVMANSEPSMCHVVPKDQKFKDEAEFFEVGQVIEYANGALVSRIDPDRVTFKYLDKEVSIIVEPYDGGKGGGGGGPATEAPPARELLERPGTWITVSGSRVTVKKQGARAIGEYPDEALKGVVMSEERLADGHMALRIDSLPPNSPLASGGLKVGDSIESINGTRVRNRAEVVAYVEKNPNLAAYTVRIIRDGNIVERTVYPER